jgi:hypothetical protein
MEEIQKYRNNKPMSCNIIVIDNFYENPYEVRNFALQQEYKEQPCTDYNYCIGKRTKSFAYEEHKKKFQEILEPIVGKIKNFPYDTDNGKFQYSTSNEHSWVHCDNANFAGIIYLTPDAPVESGTAFYKYIDGTMDEYESRIMKNKYYKYDKDMTKWKLVDKVGNIFNRLVLFDSSRFHTAVDYFGSDMYDSRLYQLFFFSVEK